MRQLKSVGSKINPPGLALVLLLLLYVGIALAHAVLAPLTTGPDELAHYEYARFIAGHGRLPLNVQERGQASYKSDQPPLYHLLAAVPMRLVDPDGPPYLKRVGDHPRRQLIERTRHAWGLYNTEDEWWPYRAEVQRWHVGRWVAILFGAATVAVTYFIARDLFGAGKDGWAAVAAAAIVAFVPRFVLTGSMLNYETTLAFFAALFLWVLLRLSQPAGPARRPHSTVLVVLLGLFTGLAIVTKLSAVILPLELLLGLGLIGRYRGWGWRPWLRAALVAGLAALVAVSWWFGFILYQFNTIARDGLWVGLLRPLIAADASDATTNRLLSMLTGGQAGFTGAIDNLESGPPWEWLAVFVRTFWMVGIETVQPLAPVALIVAAGWCLLAALGLSLVWRRNRSEVVAGPDVRLVLALLLLHLVAPLVLPLLRYAVTSSLADTAQGRHVLFMAAPAFACLWLWGWSEVRRISELANQRVSESANGPRSVGESAAPRGPRSGGHSAGAKGKPRGETGTKWVWARRFGLVAARLVLFLPGLFLLTWTGVQLWTMTWAYLPPLPVRTTPEAAAQAGRQLNRPLNRFVTLLGYDSAPDTDGRVLRVDLFWQSTAVSPVDYLTELRLVDGQGQAQAVWLGYPAGGRYPTRAWDVGDVVRDTAWLPLAGLPPGRYRLELDLQGTQLYPDAEPAPPGLDMPLTLTTLDLQETPLRRFNGSLPLTGLAATAAGYSVWQNGQALAGPGTFRYRETVLVTLSPLLPGQQRTVRMVGPPPYPPPGQPAPTEPQSFAPVREFENAALFIVGPDWPTGSYHLQVTLEGAGSVNSSSVVNVADLWQRLYVPPPLSHPLEANFANRVKLLGYDLGANRAEPGGGIPLTLTWQALDWMGQDYTVFVRLLAADQTAHGGRDRLPQEGYRTLYWAPGEIIVDPFGVPVAENAPEGIYTISIGLYQQVGQQAVSLPLVQDGQLLDVTSVSLGPVKIGRTPADFTVAAANPQVALDRPFGDGPNLTLLGYDLARTTAEDRPALRLTLYWRSEAPLPVDYTTFVHLRNPAGQVVAQQDQPPLHGAYPTSLWDPGEIIADEVVLLLPPELPAGQYSLAVGLYDFYTGSRLTVPGSADNSLSLPVPEPGR